MKPLVLLIAVCSLANAQSSSIDSMDALQETIESLFGEEGAEEETDNLDRVAHLIENPIDLNTSSFIVLQQIPGMTPLHAYRIISARETKRLTSVADLLAIEGFDEQLYRSVLPFVSAPAPRVALPFSFRMRSRILSDLQRKRGYAEGEYGGGSEKIYLRSSVEASLSETIGVKGGFLSEKDSGEELGNGFVSGYLCVVFPTVTVLAGDFVVSSGNDHLLARSAGLGRRQEGKHLIPSSIAGYQSADEQRFFRGAAVTAGVSGVSLGLFYSNKSVHGTMDDDVSFNPSTTGLFRTRTELLKRNISRERVIGGYLCAEPMSGLSVTIAGIGARFFSPRRFMQSFGIHGSWEWSRGALSGGLTRERSGGNSLVAAASVEPVAGWAFFVRHEIFTRGFSSPYGLARSPFPQSVSAAGVNGRLTRRNRITASLYREGFQHGRHGIGFSEHEHGMFVQNSSTIAADFHIELRFRMRISSQKIASRDEFGRIRSLSGIHETGRFGMTITAGGQSPVSWVTRLELSRAGAGGTSNRGIMMAQELRYRPASDIRIHTKLALFGVDAYDARIYSFEPTVPGMMVNRALQGGGDSFGDRRPVSFPARNRNLCVILNGSTGRQKGAGLRP